MFSSRLPARIEPNAVSRAVAAARSAGVPLLDLTETNPTRVDLAYPPGLSTLLGEAAAAPYEPVPFGWKPARTVIADRAGGVVPPEQVLLTASTSEAYSLIFKLLCDPGDDVLVPRPSYPLFDLLAGLDGVRAVPYRLDRHAAWAIDRNHLLHALTPRTRAVLVVSPNNPTGSMLAGEDREWLVEIAARYDLAIVADEVFAPYRFRTRPAQATMAGESRALVFTLGGLSKSAGLPQLKLAWTFVSGPRGPLEAALARLEIIADTYLSVATPVQRAAAGLIDYGLEVQSRIRERLAANLDRLRAVVASQPALTLLEPDGGWSAVLRVPAVSSEEALVLRILHEASVVAHPGYFFDFDEEAFLIISLLPEPLVFAEAVGRLAAVAGRGFS